MSNSFKNLYYMIGKAQLIAKLNGYSLADIPHKVLEKAVTEGHCEDIHLYFAAKRKLTREEYSKIFISRLDELDKKEQR